MRRGSMPFTSRFITASSTAAATSLSFRISSPRYVFISFIREASLSISFKLSHRLLSLPPYFRFTTGYLTVSGCFGLRGTSAALSIASSRTSRVFGFWAEVPTTAVPSSFESAFRSIFMPLRFASSIRLTHTITFEEISIVCKTRLRLRSRQVASQTTITASGSPKHIKFLATSSSAECARRE